MRRFFITGASSGIGKALVEECLLQDDIQVVGMSRTQTINHHRYRHVELDLADREQVNQLFFDVSPDDDEVTLFNNAGWVGPIKPLHEQTPEEIEKSYQVNLVAPAVLSANFIRSLNHFQGKKTIINISSGAANYPISGWSTYCSAKGGLNMLTRVMALESPDVTCYAIAPGIVNTPMQAQIRQADPANFPDVERFRIYHAQGDLVSPETIAGQLLSLLQNNDRVPGNVFSLRDL